MQKAGKVPGQDISFPALFILSGNRYNNKDFSASITFPMGFRIPDHLSPA